MAIFKIILFAFLATLIASNTNGIPFNDTVSKANGSFSQFGEKATVTLKYDSQNDVGLQEAFKTTTKASAPHSRDLLHSLKDDVTPMHA